MNVLPVTGRAAPDPAGLRADLQLQMAQLECRLTKWSVICAIGVIDVVMLWGIVFLSPGVGALAVGSFIAGAVAQLYAVWRM